VLSGEPCCGCEGAGIPTVPGWHALGTGKSDVSFLLGLAVFPNKVAWAETAQNVVDYRQNSLL
jgi:hypothetical protein